MECMKASQVAQWQRTSLPMQDAWVRSLAWEDPLEESIVTHSNIFFFNINLFFNWRLITLQYCSGFAIHYMNQPRVYTCSPSWTPPTSLPIPSLWVIPVHQPRAPCLMHRTWTGDLFHIWYYTCFNAILSNHSTLAFSQSPKDCSIHLCLFRCLAYRVIVTILKTILILKIEEKKQHFQHIMLLLLEER